MTTKQAVWETRKADMLAMNALHIPVGDIGAKYGVGSSRIYTLLWKWGVVRPNVRAIARSKGTAHEWLNKRLIIKSLSADDRRECILSMDIPLVCPILGTKLNYAATRTTKPENTPSIDRLDSTKGYTIGNMAIMSCRANRLKDNGTADEHLRISKWMAKMESGCSS